MVNWSSYGSDDKESAFNAGDQSSVPGLGRSPGEGNGYPLQYSFLKNPMDRGAWWATDYGVAKNWPRLSHWHLTIQQCRCVTSQAGSEQAVPLLLSSPGMLALGRSPPSGTAFLPPLRKPCQKGLLITALLSLQQQPASTENRPAWVSPGVSTRSPAEPSDGCSPSHYLTATSCEKLCDNKAAMPLFLTSKPTKSLKMIVLNELVFGLHCYVLGQFVLQDQRESTFSALTHLLTIPAAHFHFWMFVLWLLKSISPWIDPFILYTYTHSCRGTATHVHTKSITWLRFIPQITFIKTSFLNWKKTWVCRD